ncbi:amidohydrolase family protein [Fontivita pretiosa]|uniref:amidohydrolase family protein n=1 Tax=Fontivita pretiosa TaxID=2989684 RepID=UPI003D164A3B
MNPPTPGRRELKRCNDKILRLGAVVLVLSSALIEFTAAQTSQPAAGRAVYVGEELLKDYDPLPALVTRQTPIDKPRFPVIDIHCHWSIDRDPQALLTAMDRLGIRAAVNLSGGHGDELKEMLAKFTAAAPDRLLIFANIDFDRIDEPDFAQRTVAELEQAKRLGARGLKIFKSLGLSIRDKSGQLVPVDDPRLDPIWRACARLHWPVLIHSGDPIAFFQPVDRHNERWMQLKRHPDWSYFGPQFPSYAQVMAQHYRMIARHRDTVFISAHLANSGEDLATLSRWLEELPNLYVDLAGRVAELGRQPYSARRFLIRFQDRVLFGTDRYPGRKDQPRERIYYRFLETDDEYFNYYDHPFPPEGDWRIYGVFLPDEVLNKIYHENAERALAGLMPRQAGEGR